MIKLKDIAETFMCRNRERKLAKFIELFKPDRTTTILDVGAAEDEYHDSENLLEKRFPYLECITALGIHEYKLFKQRYPGVRTITYAGGRFPFSDGKFDICWCNAVIEHVGEIDKQLFFLKEINRVAKRAFITTPNRFFPFEVHTKIFLLHFLPKRIFDFLLRYTRLSWASGEYMHLLSLKKIKYLLQEAGIKNYSVIKNRIFGFVVDYVVII